MIRLLLSLALAGLCALPARAQGDVEAFRAAHALGTAGDWAGAEARVAGAGDLTRDLVRWMRLRAGTAGGASFEAYRAFLAARPHWPGLDRLRRAGEATIPPGADPQAVLAFFGEAQPLAGAGAVARARAEAALGRAEAARAVIERAWLDPALTAEGEALILAAFPEVVAPLHWQRTEDLLWAGRAAEAARMLPLLSGERRQLAEARLAVIRGDADRQARIDALPAPLRADPGLAHDRFAGMMAAGDYSDAAALLSDRSADAAALGRPQAWAPRRALLARWAMREGRPREAYALAAAHHLTTGDSFADLEWLAGYVALRYFDEPGRARTHFERMQGAVATPISLARAGYWIGRAEDAAGRSGPAVAAYEAASRHPATFYGLLAAERLGLPLDPALAGGEVWPDWRESGILSSDLVAAMLLLVAAEDRNAAALFALKIAQERDRDTIGRVGTMLAAMEESFLTLTLAKEAAEKRGWIIPALYFPLHPLARMELPVEPALALAIARRESEFHPGAQSPAGALGLMQVMPATAEEVARSLGLPFAASRLTADWSYNATLGARYLADLQAMFGPSPVMIAAGYNAGPSRPRTWITQRGDPRTGGADVVDWIEHIPFAETRTYVMRVTEAIPAYRARLTGETGPVAFTALLNGAPPKIRPLARPWGGALPAAGAASAPALQAVEPVAAPPAPAPPSALAPLRALRPVARP